MSAIAEPVTDETAIVVPTCEPPAQPFRGIAPFRFIDQPIFFGRMAESQRLLRLATMFRGVLLFGDSGAGKSSLLNARFVPEAIADGFLPERIRVQPRVRAEIVIDRIALRERGMPPFLPSNLVASGDDPRAVLSCEELRERISRADVKGYPLLLFDQFEEFVTLFEVAPRTAEERVEAAEAQERLLDLLVHFLVASEKPVKLLFAFREDYFTKLQKLFARCRDLMDQSLRLLPPSVDELPLTIRGPFEKNPGMFANPLPSAVCEQLEAELRERSSGGMQNPSEVQIAGLMLWLAKDPRELLVRRKVQGLLEDYLVQQLDALPHEAHAPAVALLSCLVTDAGTRNIVSRSDLIDRVTESENVTEDAVGTTLDALVQNTGLVRQEFRDRTAFYQIISEFLVPWIRTQKAERERIEAERRLAQERTEAEARLTQEREQAEQKLAIERAEAERRRAEDQQRFLSEKLRGVRRARAILAVLVLFLLTGWAVAVWQSRRALNESRVANAEKASALEAKRTAEAARETIAQEKESAQAAEDSARTALEQNSRLVKAAEMRLRAANQALHDTNEATKQLLDSVRNPAARNWDQVAPKLEAIVRSSEGATRQVSASIELTKQEGGAVRSPTGWSIYGRLQNDEWTDRYFHDEQSEHRIPGVGDILAADTFINVRRAPRRFDAQQQKWRDQPIVGVIAPNQRIKVTQVEQVSAPNDSGIVRVWIQGEPAPAP